jgi:hypothetical protein
MHLATTSRPLALLSVLLLPASALGGEYYALSWPTTPLDLFDIGGFPPQLGYLTAVATGPGTTRVDLTTTPTLAGVNGVALAAGEWLQFESAESFVLNASGPVLVGQYLLGGMAFGELGDPSLIIATPVKQHRLECPLAVPDGFGQHYLTVARPTGSFVSLDGALVPNAEFQAIPGAGYGVAHLAVESGAHTVLSEGPAAVYAIGFGPTVSYGYPACTGLKPN